MRASPPFWCCCSSISATWRSGGRSTIPAGRGGQRRCWALVGAINLPIIKFSVDWWSTLHQPASISRFGAPAIDPAMLRPLLVMYAAFFFFWIAVVLVRIRAELAERRLAALAAQRSA